jgi:ClpP class serine protease
MHADSLMREWPAPAQRAPFTVDGSVAIVDIRGPLEQHADTWCDSYEVILARVAAALASPAQKVLMRIDSPGGVVNGCLEAARQLRMMAAAHGKPLVAYADEHACSAAYALASAASVIALPPTGRVGSIGVIEVMRDESKAAAMAGLAFTPITSGARKADGLPVVPLTDDAQAAIQLAVDTLARAFFALCAEHRGGSPNQFAALQAAVYYGLDAVTAGLADQVISFPALLAQLNGAQMALGMKEVMAALGALAEGDGDEAAAAVKMLKAMAAPDAPADAPEEKPEEEAKAEDDAPPPSEKKENPFAKAEDSAAAASAASSAMKMMASQLQAVTGKIAALEAEKAKAEANAFYASVPHLAPELAASLRKLPLAQAKEIASSIPKPSLVRPSAVATATGTRGEGVGGDDPLGGARPVKLPFDQKRALDIAMGLAKPQLVAVRDVGSRREMGVLEYATPEGVPGIPQPREEKKESK